MTKGRRRLTCHHEAGHVLARWYFGHFTYMAHVLTLDQVARSVPIVDRMERIHYVEGMVESYDICSRRARRSDKKAIALALGIEVAQDFEMAPHIELIECYAGAYAEAQFTGDHVDDVLLVGGNVDEDTAIELAAHWSRNEKEMGRALFRARQRAEALVSSNKARRALGLMADILIKRGKVKGEKLENACTEAFGATPSYGCWREYWPPTLVQLRAGFIPASRD